MLHAAALPGNPSEGHTLRAVIEDTQRLTDREIERVYVDNGLGLRRLDSEDVPDTSKVTVTAQVVAAKRNDTALEQIVNHLSFEPNVSAATWQIDRSIPEG
jgi:uncharacterized membrane protein YhiD involved in acid resistance